MTFLFSEDGVAEVGGRRRLIRPCDDCSDSLPSPQVQDSLIEPEDDSCSERYGEEEDFRAPIIACCDPPPVLEAEYDLDANCGVCRDACRFYGLVPYFSAGDAGRDVFFVQGIAEPVGMHGSLMGILGFANEKPNPKPAEFYYRWPRVRGNGDQDRQRS